MTSTMTPEQFAKEFERFHADKPEVLLAAVDLWGFRTQFDPMGEEWVDRLVLAARELNQRDTAEKFRIHPHRRRQVDVRVDYTPLAKYAGCHDQVALSVGWWLTNTAGGYASTTAGQLRAVFTPTGYAPTVEQRLDGESLRTLPWPLPADNDAVVLLFDARQPLAQLLLAFADNLDEAVCDERRKRLEGHLVRRVRRPSEDPRLLRD